MKTSLLLASLATLAVMTAGSSGQSVIPVNDWYSVSNATGTAIVDGDTSSPTIQNVSSASINAVFGYFEPVTLADGQKLILSFDITYDLAGEAASKVLDMQRFGLFTSSTPHATPAIFGEKRVVPGTTGNPYAQDWSGFLLINPVNPNVPPSTNAQVLYYKDGIGGYGYSSTNGAAGTAGLATTGAYNIIFNNGETRTFTLELERSGVDLIVSGSYGTGTFSGTAKNAISDSKYSIFDAFGYTSGSTDNVTIDKVHFSNVTVTVIPESSTFALLVAGGIAAAFPLFLRRPLK